MLQWLQSNTVLFLTALFVVYVIAFNKLPSITTWQSFVDTFESKGAQLLLLWVTDLIFVTLIIRYWKTMDSTLQTTIVGILAGVNGAFLGAVGARNTSGGNNGNGSHPDTLKVGFISTEKKP